MATKQRPPVIQRHKHLYFDVTQDPSDGLWYAEVFGRDGKTIHLTSEHPTREEATKKAMEFIEGQKVAA